MATNEIDVRIAILRKRITKDLTELLRIEQALGKETNFEFVIREVKT